MTGAPPGASSLLDRLAERAPSEPDAVAIRESNGDDVRYRDLLRRARTIATSLQARGLEPGDRVLFSVRPGVAATVLMLGIYEAGGVIVAMDPTVGDAVFATRVATIGARWVVADSLLLAVSARWLRVLRQWRGVQLAPLGSVPHAAFVRAGRWLPGVPRSVSLSALERGTAGLHAPSASRQTQLSDPAFIVFTSGTVSAPKAVVHTRGSLEAIVDCLYRELRMRPSDVLYARDLHLILPALLAGATVVVPRSTRFSARQTLGELSRFEVTHTFMVSSDCRRLLEYCLARALRLPGTLRTLLIGAAPVHTALLRRLREILPDATTAWCVYGATEILPIASVPLEEKLAYAGDGDLVGTPVRGVDVRLSNDGELLVRGPALFAGYVGQPPVVEHATGDLARIDAGRIVLLGRAKDMIIRGEHNIYPELHEPTIERIPGVRRAALIGEYDPQLDDERVVLVVEPERGIDAETLQQRVDAAIRSGPLSIDTAARPDLILAMPLPEGGRSSKIDKVALRALVRARRSCA